MQLNEHQKNFLSAFKETVCITRDQNGRTFICKDKPTLDVELGEWEDADFIELDPQLFPDLDWQTLYYAETMLKDAK